MDNKTDDAINNIEEARERNNHNWMGILRIAMHHAPKETKELLGRIYEHDAFVCSQVKRLISED